MQRTSETSFNICLEKTLAADVSLEDLEAEYKALSTYAIDILAWEKQEWIQELIAKKRKKAEAKAKADPEPEPEAEPEVSEMDALWDAFNKRLPKWKAKYADSGYKENDLIQGATEAELFDALRLYRDSDRTGPVTAEEIQEVTDLMKKQSYPFARRVREVLRGKREEGLTDVDRCYAENQLQIIRNAMSPLLDRLGVEGMAQHDKETLTADVHDVFLEYENVPTESEIIVALLDVIDGILASEISDGRFDTLDNEVLCEDDEADRQAMNSDLVTEVEE